jgi:hypothetical protein
MTATASCEERDFVADKGQNRRTPGKLQRSVETGTGQAQPGTGTPLHTQEPVTVASFRTWRGWRECVARDRCLTFHVTIRPEWLQLREGSTLFGLALAILSASRVPTPSVLFTFDWEIPKMAIFYGRQPRNQGLYSRRGHPPLF